MVHCPYDARPGQKIRFQLPIQLSKNELKTYSIHYNKEGWVRCVGTDLRFHWARHDGGPGTVATASNGPSAPLPDNGSNSSGSSGVAASSGGGGLHRKSSDGSYIQGHRVEHLGSTFNVEGSAFVRKLSLLEGSKPPAHTLELVRAEEASLDAAVFDANITFQHLSKVSGQPFQAKLQWFKSQCDVLRVPWDVEHQHIKLRREHLLDDSMRALESIRPDQMRQRFRFEFIGEPGVDAGGVAREWFHIVSELLFNPDIALFQYSSINQMCMQINPSSGVANSEHLLYFHFAGTALYCHSVLALTVTHTATFATIAAATTATLGGC
eukprot:19413-Heterococcus_DN1.PRE.2